MEQDNGDIHHPANENEEFIITKKDWELIEKRLNDLERIQDKLYDNLKKSFLL